MYIDCKTQRVVSMGTNNATKFYLKDVRKTKPLSPAKQSELIKDYNTIGSDKEKIRNELIETNQGFVLSIARHLSSGDDFNDLIDEGNLGLIEAIERFDCECDNNFLTYASHWVRKKMTDYIVSNKLIKPKNAVRVYAYAESAKNKYFAENGRFPTSEELINILDENGVYFSNKEDLYPIDIISMHNSLDEDCCGSDDASEWFDDLYYEQTKNEECSSNISQHLENLSVKAKVEEVLSYLNENEKEIICQYFGIGGRQYSANEIAYRLNTTSEKIEKFINKCIKKIRKNGKIEINVQ